MAAAAAAGGGGFAEAFEQIKGFQEAELAFQGDLTKQKGEFQAASAKMEMEDAMNTKMARLVSRQAQALSQ